MSSTMKIFRLLFGIFMISVIFFIFFITFEFIVKNFGVGLFFAFTLGVSYIFVILVTRHFFSKINPSCWQSHFLKNDEKDLHGYEYMAEEDRYYPEDYRDSGKNDEEENLT